MKDARGREIKMEPGYCIWCGHYVEEGREMSGATNPLDPAWQVDGDFGCDQSPQSNDDGVGDHMRPYDLAIRLMKEAS
jgi:hypothetical protein